MTDSRTSFVSCCMKYNASFKPPAVHLTPSHMCNSNDQCLIPNDFQKSARFSSVVASFIFFLSFLIHAVCTTCCSVPMPYPQDEGSVGESDSSFCAVSRALAIEFVELIVLKKSTFSMVLIRGTRRICQSSCEKTLSEEESTVRWKL